MKKWNILDRVQGKMTHAQTKKVLGRENWVQCMKNLGLNNGVCWRGKKNKAKNQF